MYNEMKKVDYYKSTIHSLLAPTGRRQEHRHIVTEWQDGHLASNILIAEDEYTSMKHTLSQAKSCQTVTFYAITMPRTTRTVHGLHNTIWRTPKSASAVAVPCAGHKAMSQPLTIIQNSKFKILNSRSAGHKAMSQPLTIILKSQFSTLNSKIAQPLTTI